MGVCNGYMFCCTLLYVHTSIAIIFMGKRELIALLNLSSWCLGMVERLFLAVPRGCLQFVMVVFPDHTHLPFFFTSYMIGRDDIPRRYLLNPCYCHVVLTQCNKCALIKHSSTFSDRICS